MDNLVLKGPGSTKMKRTRWAEAKSGTRYEKPKAPERKPKAAPPPEPAAALLPFLKGEAEGDLRLAVLMAVRNVLKTEKAHCRTARAVDREGKSVEVNDERAARWSVIGAIALVSAPYLPGEERRAIIAHMKKFIPQEWQQLPFFKWEEARTTRFTQILHMLNMSIAVRKKELGYEK